MTEKKSKDWYTKAILALVVWCYICGLYNTIFNKEYSSKNLIISLVFPPYTAYVGAKETIFYFFKAKEQTQVKQVKSETERFIELAVKEVSKKIPFRVDEYTVLNNVSGIQNGILYSFVVSDDISDFVKKSEEMKSSLRKGAIVRYCAYPEYEMLRDRGIDIVHKYFDQRGEIIVTSKGSINDCNNVTEAEKYEAIQAKERAVAIYNKSKKRDDIDDFLDGKRDKFPSIEQK